MLVHLKGNKKKGIFLYRYIFHKTNVLFFILNTNKTSFLQHGVGLGLDVCQKLVYQIGRNKIKVNSQVG